MAEKDVIHVFDNKKEGRFGIGVSDGFYTESKIMIGETGITVVRPSPIPKRVMFNYPATIVFWNDGTKTVVKCGDQDTWDEEKGLAMAFAKKMLGNKYDYYGRFHGWIKKATKSKMKKKDNHAELSYGVTTPYISTSNPLIITHEAGSFYYNGNGESN